MPAIRSPVSFAKLHSSTPWSASQSSPPKGIPGRLKRSDPSDHGWAAKPKPPRSRTARAIAAGVEPAVAHVLVEAEREVVVAAERRHLLADQQQHVAVPALLAGLLRAERVVVGEQHHVGARPRRGPRDLRHRAGAVRVRRVDVGHAGEVVHGAWVVSKT